MGQILEFPRARRAAAVELSPVPTIDLEELSRLITESDKVWGFLVDEVDFAIRKLAAVQGAAVAARTLAAICEREGWR